LITKFDIAVVGGGLSGLLTLASLINTNTNLSIALIEANTIKPSQKNEFDDRVLALSHGSVQYLKSLNVWHLMANDATPIANIHISDRGHYGKARISANEHQVSALGYVIPLASIANALLAFIKGNKSIAWLVPNHIEQIDFQLDQVHIAFKDFSIETKLVIACDGGQSICRKAANIAVKQEDYQQSAVIANVVTDKPHNNRAYERFTQNGPIAMLPMSGNQCSLVWTVSPEQAIQLSELTDEDFCTALTQAFGCWLGRIEQASKRTIFPLTLVAAETQCFHRMALVGNASHTIHPIAGQGFNLGLRDVRKLSSLICEATKKKQDIGGGKLLNLYQQSREQDQRSIIKLTDSMVTLFSNDLSPLIAGRNIGLKVVNYLSPLQKAFVNKTMGY